MSNGYVTKGPIVYYVSGAAVVFEGGVTFLNMAIFGGGGSFLFPERKRGGGLNFEIANDSYILK